MRYDFTIKQNLEGTTDDGKPKPNPEYFGVLQAGNLPEDGTVYVKLTGQCATCPSAGETLEGVVKEMLMSEIPEIKDVVLDQSISEDLLDMARKLLNK